MAQHSMLSSHWSLGGSIAVQFLGEVWIKQRGSGCDIR
jgi:hypothetical protein